jgi:MFS family permease
VGINARYPGNARGIPDLLAVLMFMAGAAAGFAFVGTLAFGGVTKHFDRERGQALPWGSFHFFSVGLAVLAAALVAHYVQSFMAWPMAAFLSTAIYLIVLGPSLPPPTCGTHKVES